MHSHFCHESVVKNVVDVALFFFWVLVVDSKMIFYFDLLGINTSTIVKIL